MKNTATRYTYIYVIFVAIYTAIYCIQSDGVALLDSAGLGDFLSGFFAPLAFLYLFLGFRQQEKALNKTNEDLLKQLKIQQQMLEIQQADQKAKEHAAQPILDTVFSIMDQPYDSEQLNLSTCRPYETFRRRITLVTTNSGEKVSRLSITCITPFRKSMVFNKVLDASGIVKAHLSIKETDLQYYNEDNFLNLEFELTYTTSLGITYKTIYEAQISTLPDNLHLTYGGLINTIRCD